MPAPIVIELAPNYAYEKEFTQALVGGCSRAIGRGGCTLGAAEGAPDDARARILVSFWDGYSHVRIEAIAPALWQRVEAREISFRDDDPLPERFRAAGVVAAGLVSDLDAAAPGVSPSDVDNAVQAHAGEAQPSADKAAEKTEHPRRTRSPALSAAALLGLDGPGPRGGIWVGVDVPFEPSAAYAALSVSYEQAWPDDNGISLSREGLGLGVGLRAPVIPGTLALRGWAQLQLEDLHASIRQPKTGRQDAGARFLIGLGVGGDVLWPIDARLSLFAGARVAWLRGDTTVRVEGKAMTLLSAFASSLALGLDVQLP